MKRTIKLLAISAAALVTTFVMMVLPVGVYAANVTGEWNLSVETPNGAGTPTLILKQDGETLTGTYKGRFGEAPLKGTIKDNAIKFTVTINVQGQDLEIEYAGTVDGDSMKGKAKFGDMGEGAFTGKKAAAKPPASSK